MHTAGTLLAGRYEVLRTLGEHTLVVRDQEQPESPERVLRLLAPEDARSIRFELERTMGIDHPAVARVHALGELEDGRGYYVQDLVEGEDLFQWGLARNPSDVVAVFAQLLQALGCYHALGLVPGGRRPLVIRVEQPGDPETAQLRLIDPGGVVEEFSRAGLGGTAHAYALAPERRAGAKVDRRASLYEAGLILYELLAGSDSLELRTMDLEGPPPVTQLAPGLPLDLATFVMVILRPFPDDRPPSVEHALDTLERISGQRLVEERRSPRLPLPTRCVGRATELEELTGFAQSLLTPISSPGSQRFARSEPTPTYVVIRGQPGIGKRRLLDEFALRLGLEEVTIFRGQCGLGGQGPLGPVADLYRQLLELPRFRRQMAQAHERFHWALRALLPERAAQLPAGTSPLPLSDQNAARLRLQDSLAAILLEAARTQPLAIFVSDLDQARPPTRSFLAHLGRAAWSAHTRFADAPPLKGEPAAKPPPRLLIVATSGNDDYPDPRNPVAPFWRAISLMPLETPELLSLAGACLGKAECPAGLRNSVELYAHGHPGRSLDLVRRHLAEREPPTPSTDELAAQPNAFVVEQSATVGELSQPAVDVLIVLGCLGRPAPVDLLTWATGATRHVCEASIEELVELGFVERLADRQVTLAQSGLREELRRRFPEETQRQQGRLAGFLAESIPKAAWRTPLERPLEVAELAAAAGEGELLRRFGSLGSAYLESLFAGERCAQLCLALADISEGEEARGLRRRAAENLQAVDEPLEAERVLRGLVDEPGDVSSVEKSRLWSSLHQCLLAQDKEEEARTALSWAHTYVEEEEEQDGDPELALQRARVCVQAAELHASADEREDAALRAQEGLELLKNLSLDSAGNQLRAKLLAVLGQASLLEEDFKHARQMLKAAMAIQERGGMAEDAALTLQRLGNVAFAAGNPAIAENHWSASLEQWERLGDRRHTGQLCSTLGLAAARRGSLGEARELLSESLRLREEAGDPRGMAASLHNLGYVYVCAGALEEASRAYEQCLALRLQEDDRWYAASASNNLGQVLLDLGRSSAARQFLSQALEARQELGDRRGEAASLANLAELDLRRGEYATSRQRLALAERIREEHDDPDDKVDTLRRRARCSLALGDLRQAQADASQAIALADKHKLTIYDGPNHLLLGEVLARRGRRTPARRELERARRSADRIGDRITGRAASIELAALRLAGGHPGDARALLDSRPVPRPGRLKPLEGRLPPDKQGVLRVRERLLRARIELSLESGSVTTAARCAEQALAEARRAELRDLEWRALQALAATAELRGSHEQALSLTLEAQELVEQLLTAVPEEGRDAYLGVDPLREAALAGDSPIIALAVKASSDHTPHNPTPLADPDASEQLLAAMVESTMPTIQPARQQRGITRALPTPSDPTAAGSAHIVDRSDFNALVRLNRLIVDEPNVGRVLEAIVAEAVRLCGAERGFLALFGETADDTTVLATQGIDEVERQGQGFFRRCAYKAATSGQLVLSAEARVSAERKQQALLVGLGLRSVLAAPVTPPDGRRGALYLDHGFQVGRFADHEVDLIEALADQCAMAIGRGALEAAIQGRHGITPGSAREYLTAKASSERAPVHLGDPARGLIGCSTAMRKAISTLERAAKTDVAVLIQGPPGVGKGVAARALHQASGRAGPLVTVDLRELADDKVEVELFGHEAGAFPGAEEARPGLFRRAEGGTLLLEHIGQAPTHVLLKVEAALEERTVRPLGASEPVSFNARIVSTSGVDLDELVRSGRMREPMLLLLAELRVALPPLDERPEDKGPLLNALLATWKREGQPPILTAGARALLETRSYPGNAREMNAVLAACAALAGEEPIEPDDLPVERQASPPPLREALSEFERKYIESALLTHQGDLTKAAQALGISRRSLKRKLEQL